MSGTKRCSIKGCDSEDKKLRRGWCESHYGRWKRHGDPLVVARGRRPQPEPPADAPDAYVRFMNGARACSVQDCPGVAESRGMCLGHFRQWRKTTYSLKLCKLPACGFDVLAHDMCRRHYSSWYRHGTPYAPVRSRARKGERPHRVYVRAQFGLSKADVEDMKAAQNNLCAICGRAFERTGMGRPALDHCHETNRLRELLCGYCNRGIGLFQDVPERLEAAARYLRKHSEAAPVTRDPYPASSPR